MIMMMVRWGMVMMTVICYLLLVLNRMLMVLSYSWWFSTPKVLWQMQNSWERRKQFSEGGQNKFWTKIE